MPASQARAGTRSIGWATSPSRTFEAGSNHLKNKALAPLYPELGAGGFTRDDGTIEFYGRINALLQPDMIAIDLGAGRGCQFEDTNAYRRGLLRIQGKVAKVIGVDVDPAVLTNSFVDEAKVYEGGLLPLDDACADLIYSDWVLEHVEDPVTFAAEVDRVLRPGGWFCARTPTSHSLTALGSRIVPNRQHAQALQSIQAGTRKAEDVFPAFYKLNTLGALRKLFPAAKWNHFSYTFSPSPAYYFGKTSIARLMSALLYVKQPVGGENLFVFLQKQ
jgi:SAM-dependent methyltransferase